MRAARLRALERSTSREPQQKNPRSEEVNSNDNTMETVDVSHSMSTVDTVNGSSFQGGVEMINDGQMNMIAQVLYLGGGANADDMSRWYNQGFEFAESVPSFNFGLKQGHGGPCGVLAAVQAEMLTEVLFDDSRGINGDKDEGTAEIRELSSEEKQIAFSRSLARILARCRAVDGGPLRLVTGTAPDGTFEGFEGASTSSSLKYITS